MEIAFLPAEGASGKGAQSATVRWLDGTGGEGSGIYEYDEQYDRPDSLGFANIIKNQSWATAAFGGDDKAVIQPCRAAG